MGSEIGVADGPGPALFLEGDPSREKTLRVGNQRRRADTEDGQNFIDIFSLKIK